MMLRFKPGYVSDMTNIGAQGFFKDGDGVRFRNGLPEAVGSEVDALTTDGDTITYRGVCRALHDWADLDGVSWVAIGTSKKLYLQSATDVYDITPQRAQTTPTDPFQTDSTGAYDPNGLSDARFVRVTDTAHGARAGDVVNIASATAVGGITLDGDYEIVRIDSVNEYTIRSADAATSTATGGGTPTITYDINGGLNSGFVQPGYGAGLYGVGPYGETNETAPTVDGFNPGARIWSLDNWGEDLLAAPKNETLYWWDRTNGGSTKAQVVANAPNRMQRFYVSQQFRYAIAFGASSGTDTERDPLLIRWSDSEDFTVWAADPETNTAGSHRIDSGSEIITAVKARSEFLVWTDQSMHRFFYVNDPGVIWTSLPVANNVRIAGPNAAVTAGSITYWMGIDKFYVFDGVHRTLPCPVWNRVFKDFNRFQSDQVVASVNEEYGEVRWDYPSAGSTTNDRYVIYNYELGCWYFGTDAYSFVNEKSPAYSSMYAATGGDGFSDDVQGRIKLIDAESGSPTTRKCRYVETGDFLFDEGAVVVFLQRMYPNFAEISGHVDVSLYVKLSPQDSRYYRKRFRDVSTETRFLNPELRGRQAYLRIESRYDGDRWRMGYPQFDLSADGTR